jgi:hypothetical protein
MFTEPHIPRHPDLPTPIRILTSHDARTFFQNVAMGRKRIDEVDGISGRKNPDGTHEHLVRLHTPIRVVNEHTSLDALAVLVTKDPQGDISCWWYDDVKEADMEWDNQVEDDE